MTVAFAGLAQAQTSQVSPRSDRLVAQASTGTQTPDATMVALQAAIDSKDTAAIFNLLNQTPRDQRGPMAALLLSAAQGLTATDKQFAASLAALAFASGGLTGAQQASAIAIIRNAPAGLAVVANLLSTAPTGGFGFPSVITVSGLFNLVVTENQNQTQSSPN